MTAGESRRDQCGPVPPEQIQTASDRRAIEEGCYFDQSAADRVIYFIETFCCYTGDRWLGKPFRLLKWQRDLVTRIYGWKLPDGTRRFRQTYIEIPKKNGKSELVSALVLYHLLGDGVRRGEVYLCAYTREQAAIVYEAAALMVESSPLLKAAIDVQNSHQYKIMTFDPTHSVVKVMSSDAPSADGKSASLTVFDELHRQRTRALWDVMEYAGSARESPLLLVITTAGDDKTSICYAQHTHARSVLDGTIIDVAFFALIYGADPEKDDLDSPEVWARVNPSWDITIRPGDFAREHQKAKGDPLTWSNFQRLRLGVWVQPATRIIDAALWDACKAPFSIPKLAGKDCFGALDLSNYSDISAFVLAFPTPSDVRLLPTFWLPEEYHAVRARKDRNLPWEEWRKKGFIRVTEGRAIDYAFIKAEVLAASKRYKLKRLFLDPWNAVQIGTELIALGLKVEIIDQTFKVLNAPTKEMLRLIAAGKLRHGDHPVMNWMAGNALAKLDDNENMRITKGLSRDKVDGIAATVMTMHGLVTYKPPKKPTIQRL